RRAAPGARRGHRRRDLAARGRLGRRRRDPRLRQGPDRGLQVPAHRVGPRRAAEGPDGQDPQARDLRPLRLIDGPWTLPLSAPPVRLRPTDHVSYRGSGPEAPAVSPTTPGGLPPPPEIGDRRTGEGRSGPHRAGVVGP